MYISASIHATFLHLLLQVTETPEGVCKEAPLRNSPRIAAFIGEESQQYFVLIEQCVLCQVPSFQFAVFVMFSAYYAFHLEYRRMPFFFSKTMSYHFPMDYVGLLLTLRPHLISKELLRNH